jgi:hypothetical protein
LFDVASAQSALCNFQVAHHLYAHLGCESKHGTSQVLLQLVRQFPDCVYNPQRVCQVYHVKDEAESKNQHLTEMTAWCACQNRLPDDVYVVTDQTQDRQLRVCLGKLLAFSLLFKRIFVCLRMKLRLEVTQILGSLVFHPSVWFR